MRLPKFERLLAILFCLICAVLVWRCWYGFANADEHYYLMLPYRFCHGDVMFNHDWTLAQLSGFLTLPLMKVFLTYSPNGDYMVLFFRLAYVFCWILGALVTRWGYSKISKCGAWLAAIILLLYVPFGIPALSYNSIPLICFAVMSGLLLRVDEHPRAFLFLSGFLFSCAVLCHPHIIVIYGLALAVALFQYFRHAEKRTFVRRSVVWFTLGAFALALVLMTYLALTIDFEKAIKVIGIMLNDPEHVQQSLIRTVVGYFDAWCFHFKGNWFFLSCWIVLLLCLAFDKRKESRFWIYLSISAIFAISHFGWVVLFGKLMNHTMLPAALLSVILVLLVHNEVSKKVFAVIIAPSFVYSFLIFMASNQRLNAISSALSLAALGCYLILPFAIEKVDRKSSIGRMVVLLSLGLFCLHAVALMERRVRWIYWDNARIGEQRIMITEGPQRGIRVSAEKFDEYQNAMDILRQIRSDDGVRSVLIYPSKPYHYAIANKDIASYRSWSVFESCGFGEMIKKYYDVFPEKKPDCIVLLDKGKSVKELPDDLLHDYKVVNELKQSDAIVLYRLDRYTK